MNFCVVGFGWRSLQAACNRTRGGRPGGLKVAGPDSRPVFGVIDVHVEVQTAWAGALGFGASGPPAEIGTCCALHHACRGCGTGCHGQHADSFHEVAAIIPPAGDTPLSWECPFPGAQSRQSDHSSKNFGFTASA